MSEIQNDTDFVVAGRPTNAGSMRGIKGDVSPIDNGVVVEMLDYSLRDLTAAEGRKYEGSLSCEDLHAPPLFGMWKGSRWTVDLPVEFVEPVGEAQGRPAVPGSVYFVDAEESDEVPAGDPRAAFRVYRPRLDVFVVEPWKVAFDEWGASTSWSLKWREA